MNIKNITLGYIVMAIISMVFYIHLINKLVWAEYSLLGLVLIGWVWYSSYIIKKLIVVKK